MFKRHSITDIGDYYNQSTKWYSLLWSDKDSLAMHYGYWDNHTKTRKEALTNPYCEIIKILKPRKGDLLLDSGCGIGGATFYMARNTEAKVIGITISKKQIEIAKKMQKTIKKDVASRTKFYYMDYAKTSFNDGLFDGICSVESFCHSYPDMRPLLREMYRLLKKGGKIVMIDGILCRYPENEREQYLLGKFFEGWKLNGGLMPKEIINQFKEVGFKKVVFVDKTKTIKNSASRLYIIGLLGYPIFKLLTFLNIVSDVVFKNVYSAIYQKRLQEIGIMGHGIFHAEK